MLAFCLLYLIKVVEEKHGIFVTVVCPGEDVPSDARCPRDLVFFISKENVDTLVLELDNVLKSLLFVDFVKTLIPRSLALCRLEHLRHLLLGDKLVIRVEVDLYLANGAALLMNVKGLLEKLRKSDQQGWAVRLRTTTTFALANKHLSNVLVVADIVVLCIVLNLE